MARSLQAILTLEQNTFYSVLIREGEGVAARVLNNLGVSLNKARQQVLQLLGSNEASSGHQGGSATNANTPTDSLARDLTVVARENRLDPVIGRGKEFNV